MLPDLEQEIAKHSYFMWEHEGKPEGKQLEHWFQAKAELEAKVKPAKTAKKSIKAPRAFRAKSSKATKQKKRVARKGS